MPPPGRVGTLVKVRGRPIPFNYWPVAPTATRYGIQDVVFATEPWSVMRGVVRSRVPAALRPEARSYLDQAEDFLLASNGRSAASPVLLYYCFLNVAKAAILAGGFATALADAVHGLSIDVGGTLPGPMGQMRLAVQNITAPKFSVFTEMLKACGLTAPAASTYPLGELVAQVVIGHRLWREATRLSERFLPIDRISFMENRATGQLWLDIWINASDMSRYGWSGAKILTDGGFVATFKEVVSSAPGLRRFERLATLPFGAQPSSLLLQMAQSMKSLLWRTFSTTPPYRQNYLYLSLGLRFPQLASLYGIFFALGHLNRYRPAMLTQLLDGPYGPFLTEFLASQPEQLLYAFASEMHRREVIRSR